MNSVIKIIFIFVLLTVASCSYITPVYLLNNSDSSIKLKTIDASLANEVEIEYFINSGKTKNIGPVWLSGAVIISDNKEISYVYALKDIGENKALYSDYICTRMFGTPRINIEFNESKKLKLRSCKKNGNDKIIYADKNT